MSTYFVQGSTMDAIADAINAKTGGSSAMTPAQMVTAIGSISGGGGRVLVANYTASEDVSAIKIDFTQAMRGYTYYIVEMSGTVTGSIGPYMGLNTETATRFYTVLAGSTLYSAMIFVYSATKVALVGGSSTQTFDLPLAYLHIRAYNENSIIRAGTTVKIWGVN